MINAFQKILCRLDNWINERSGWIVDLIKSCHVRHLNPVKIHPESITKNDKKLTNGLYYYGAEFPVREKDFSKIEMKNNICINVLCYVNKLVF